MESPKIVFDDRESAEHAMNSLLSHRMIIEVERQSSKNVVLIPRISNFEEEKYYAWIYQGSALKQRLYALLVVVGLLTGVMFPLWPESMRIGVWYISMGALGLIGLLLIITVIRLIVYLLTAVLLKPGIWWYPNLYADVGFFASFKPFWGWHGEDYLPDDSGEKKAERRKQRRLARKGKKSGNDLEDDKDL